MNLSVTEMADQPSRSFKRKAYLLSKHLRSTKYFWMWGFLSDWWMEKWIWWAQRILEKKIHVCQTTELAENLLRTSATCSWPKACYLSNVLTTVIFSFFRLQLKNIIMYLGCSPVKESKDYICSSYVFHKTLDESFPLTLKANNSGR